MFCNLYSRQWRAQRGVWHGPGYRDFWGGGGLRDWRIRCGFFRVLRDFSVEISMDELMNER